MTQPRQMIASADLLSAILRAAVGISNEPGTQTTSICSGVAPWRVRVFSQPSSILEVMYSVKRATTMAKRKPFARKSPSKVRPCPLRRLAMRLRFKDRRGEVYAEIPDETRGEFSPQR